MTRTQSESNLPKYTVIRAVTRLIGSLYVSSVLFYLFISREFNRFMEFISVINALELVCKCNVNKYREIRILRKSANCWPIRGLCSDLFHQNVAYFKSVIDDVVLVAQLVHSFVHSRLDYGSSVLAGLPKSTIMPLQRVQNAAARLNLDLRMNERVTPALRQLHGCPSTVEWTSNRAP